MALQEYAKNAKKSASRMTSGRYLKDIPRGKPASGKNTAPKTAQALSRLMAQYPEVQLATLVDAAPAGEKWVHEIKFDGYRLLGFVVGGEVRLRTRNGNDWTGSFPAIAAALAKLKADDAVVDMEAVILDEEGKTSFQGLQAALGEGGRPERIVAYAFDLLHLDGENLTKLSLLERKKKLEALLRKSKPGTSLRYSEHLAAEGTAVHAQACQKGLEGIVSKLAGAPYVAGRQKSWLKIKCSLRQEFIIVGYSDSKSCDRALGALSLGYRKDGALFWNQLFVAPVPNAQGMTTHHIGIINDVTDLMRYQEELEYQANYDTLTRLPNRNLTTPRNAAGEQQVGEVQACDDEQEGRHERQQRRQGRWAAVGFGT